MSETITTLSEQLFSQLQLETFVILHTLDHESGAPTVNAISWVYAPTPTTIRFAIDQRSRLITNLSQNGIVTMTLIASGSVYAVYGKAKLIAERLDEVPIKLSCFDLEIEAVRNAMFYGARITAPPEYEKTYDKRAADKLDGQVYTAMKKV